MDTDKQELNAISAKVIGAAYEVSNVLGVGFLEKVYENALVRELTRCGLSTSQQQPLRVIYKGDCVGEYVADIVVENRLIVELKCCDGLADIHLTQCLNYLRATGLSLALLINFQKPKVEIKRVVI